MCCFVRGRNSISNSNNQKSKNAVFLTTFVYTCFKYLTCSPELRVMPSDTYKCCANIQNKKLYKDLNMVK